MHTQAQGQAWAGPTVSWHLRVSPQSGCWPFHCSLIYSLKGYVSVYTVLGPGGRAIQMDLGL